MPEAGGEARSLVFKTFSVPVLLQFVTLLDSKCQDSDKVPVSSRALVLCAETWLMSNHGWYSGALVVQWWYIGAPVYGGATRMVTDC